MSIFDIPTTSDDEIMSDIVRRIASSQTVTDDDLHRITGSTEPQVIMPLELLTRLLEQTTNEALLKQKNERLKARVAELEKIAAIANDVKLKYSDAKAASGIEAYSAALIAFMGSVEKLVAALKEPANEG